MFWNLLINARELAQAHPWEFLGVMALWTAIAFWRLAVSEGDGKEHGSDNDAGFLLLWLMMPLGWLIFLSSLETVWMICGLVLLLVALWGGIKRAYIIDETRRQRRRERRKERVAKRQEFSRSKTR